MGSSVLLPTAGQPKTGADPGFTSASQPRAVTFAFTGIAPPAPLYVRPDELIVITTIASISSTVRVTGKLLLADGSVTGFVNDIVTVADRGVHFAFILLYEGFLLSLSIGNLATTIKRGTTFIQAAIARGSATFSLGEVTLISDYLATGSGLGWPGGRIQQMVEGPGFLHSVQQANPAPGADWTYTVPSGERQAIRSLAATFTPSAAVANRVPNLAIDDGVNTLWQDAVLTAIPASTPTLITATQSQNRASANAIIQNMLLPPGLNIPAGFRVRTSTTGIQAGDQWSGIFFLLEELLEL